MSEPDSGSLSAQGEGIAQAYGPGARASVEYHQHNYPAPPPASWNWPRPWNFSGYLAEKRHGFTGRDWLFGEVRGWYADRDGAQALLVCADFGVGKSAFMADLTADAHGLPIAAYHFCHHDTIETLNPVTFVRSVAAQLAASLPAYRSAVEADPDARRWLDDVQLDPASAFERAVIGPLNAIDPPGTPQVLLVDALDEALDFETTAGSSRPTSIVRLIAARARRLPAWLRILATSRRRQDVLQPVQSAFRCATLDGGDARNVDDIYSYVLSRCTGTGLARMLEKGNRTASDIASSLSGAAQSGGKFLYAVRVLNDVESGALPLDRLNDLPPGLDGFYLDAFERRFPASEDYAPVGALLGVLCVEREPLSRADLAAIVGTPEEQVGVLLKRLEDFLKVRAKRYAFDHLSLAQWLSEENEHCLARAGRFKVELNAAEGLIAGWARRELAADRAHTSEYLARHLGAYLSTQERKVHFARLLTDFRWLDARLRTAGISALLMDCGDVNETRALNALERVFLHSAHVLGHDGSDWLGAEMLASQLLGRVQRRAEPEIQGLCVQAMAQLTSNGGLRPLADSLSSAEALQRTLEGHTGPVYALAVLAEGRLASGSEDNTIRLWCPARGVCEATLKGHTKGVFALAVLADGRLASGSGDCTIKLWNLESGGCEATLEGHTQTVSALAVLADGRLAAGSLDATISVWNPASGVREAHLEGHTLGVSALAAVTDGRLASGSWDTTIRVWNPVSRVCEATLEGHTEQVNALAVLADGRLASGSDGNNIWLWNLASGVGEELAEGYTDSVYDSAYALVGLPDGWLASASYDHKIMLWNTASGACEATLEDTNQVNALAVCADGRLATGSWGNTIRLWNLTSGVGDATPEKHTGGVTALAVLPDGRIASAGPEDDTIRLWNPAGGVCKATLVGQPGGVNALAVLADGRLASAGGNYCTLWDPARGRCGPHLGLLGPEPGHTGPVFALTVLADGRIATGSGDHTIRLWAPATGKCEATLVGHSGGVFALAVLADGRLASASSDSTIRVWNTETAACETTLEGHTRQVFALDVLADGRLASASSDAIKLWNPATSVCEATLGGYSVDALAVLADGRLASGSRDKTIRVWRMHEGRWVATVHFVADAGIGVLAFAARAGVLAAGDMGGRVHFLKVEAWSCGRD